MAPPRNSAAKAPSNMLPGSGTDVTPMSMPQLVTVLCSPPDTSATYNVQPRENLTLYKLLWDSAALKFTNLEEANKFVRRDYRAGWSL